jgi:ribonuclease-3
VILVVAGSSPVGHPSAAAPTLLSPTMESLEARLGYEFRTRRLLDTALTLPSVAHERKTSGKGYQRLEFLGDGVVDLVISEQLFHLFPEEDEGMLSKLWTRAVKTETMASIARKLGLGADLVLSRGDETAGGRNRDSTLADALEALIGAVHLDGGIEASSSLIKRLWQDELASLQLAPDEQNPKGQLQEMLQVPPWGETPTYRITASAGPDHLRNYEAVVIWKGRELASGSGRGKQEAQIAAARHALVRPDLQDIIQAERTKPIPK